MRGKYEVIVYRLIFDGLTAVNFFRWPLIMAPPASQENNAHLIERQRGNRMLSKIIGFFLTILLWVAIVGGVLITILAAVVSFRASGGQRYFDWSMTFFTGGVTAWLLYIALRTKPKVEKVSSQGVSTRPFLYHLAILALAVVAIAGVFFTMFSSNSLGWGGTILMFAITVLCPCLIIRKVLGKDNEEKNQAKIGANAGNQSVTINFWRSGNYITLYSIIFGFLFIISPPLTLIVVVLFFYEPGWATAFFALFGIFLAFGTGFLLVFQYRQIRDRHKPLILLDDIGLYFWRAREEVIPWAELMSVGLRYQKGIPVLLLGLKYPENYIDRFNRWYSPCLWIGLHVLKSSEQELVRAIREHACYVGDKE